MNTGFCSRSLAAAILALAIGTASAQVTPNGIHFSNASTGISLPIPASGTGGTGTAADETIFNFGIQNEANNSISDFSLLLDLSHTYCSDLVITLEHCGVTVTLAQNDNAQFQLAGGYIFDDGAAVAFSAAPIVAGVVSPGIYRPLTPLSAFDGLPRSGPFILKIVDQFALDSGILNIVAFEDDIVTTKVSDVGLPLPVPPSGTGGAPFGNPTSTFLRSVFVPTHGRITTQGLGVRLRIDHSFAADLRITLSHGSKSCKISDNNGGQFDLISTDSYHFNDAWFPWPPAPVAGALLNGIYRPVQPFTVFNNEDMFGPWTLTIWDGAAGDVGTLHEFELQIAGATYRMDYSQPGSTGPLTIANEAGIPTKPYFNGFTIFAPGSYPDGWFYGLDIIFSEIVNQYNAGYPFVGTLDNCGDSSYTQGGVIPPGIVINSVGVLLNGPQGVIQASSPAAYVTF